MSALVLASILNPLNTSSLATALVSIGAHLDATPAQLASLVAVVYVTSAVAQPVMGSLSVRWGARRVLFAGLVLVAAAGVVGGLAHDITGLLVARALIGLGTSCAAPAALVMLRRRAELSGMTVPTRQIATLTAAGNVMAAAGLPLGGLLVETFGWRSVFWVNTPLALIALGLALATLTETDDAHARAGEAPALDWFGVALFTTAIVTLSVFLGDVQQPRWTLIAIAVAACAVLILWERRVARQQMVPFLDVDLIGSSRPIRGVYIRSFLLSTAVYCTLYALAQWLDKVHGLSALEVGLVMLPQSALAAIAAVWAGRTSRAGRLVHASGLLLVGAAMTVFAASTLLGAAAVTVAVVTTVLTGLAFGLGMVGNQTALYLASTAEQFGVASGLMRTSSYIGGFVATAIMGVLFSDGTTNAALRGFCVVFLAAGALTVLNARRSMPRSHHADSASGLSTT
ncbi:MFS transporter [Calidifontibacter terrae]